MGWQYRGANGNQESRSVSSRLSPCESIQAYQRLNWAWQTWGKSETAFYQGKYKLERLGRTWLLPTLWVRWFTGAHKTSYSGSGNWKGGCDKVWLSAVWVPWSHSFWFPGPLLGPVLSLLYLPLFHLTYNPAHLACHFTIRLAWPWSTGLGWLGLPDMLLHCQSQPGASQLSQPLQWLDPRRPETALSENNRNNERSSLVPWVKPWRNSWGTVSECRLASTRF